MSLYGQYFTPIHSWASSGPDPSGQHFCFCLPQEVGSLNYKPKAGGVRSWEASGGGRGSSVQELHQGAEGVASLSARGQAASWLHQKTGCSSQEKSSLLALLFGAYESLGKFPELF